MKTWAVVFDPDALDDLDDIEVLIAAQDTPRAAARYIDRITIFCESLRHFPERGMARDDLGLGVRLIGFEKRLSIAIRLGGGEVRIVRVLYGGQAVTLSRR